VLVLNLLELLSDFKLTMDYILLLFEVLNKGQQPESGHPPSGFDK